MKPGLKYRMYDMEVNPPPGVWELLSKNLDEINKDNPLAKKLYETEVIPAPANWEKIKDALDTPVEEIVTKRSIPVIRYMTAAALLAGIAVSLWLVFRTSPDEGKQVQVTPTPETEQKKLPEDNALSIPVPDNNNVTISEQPSSSEKTKSSVVFASASLTNKKNEARKANDFIPISDKITELSLLSAAMVEDILQKPEFGDLSLVSSDDQYLTMVNANGRLVKIPVHLAHLAPRFQNKPVEEDYYEIIFGQGSYWKEKFDQWRQSLATNPSMNGDIFSSVIAVLRSIDK